MSNPIASDEQIKQWSKDISRAEIMMLRKQLATVSAELAKLRDEIASGEPVAEFEGHGHLHVRSDASLEDYYTLLSATKAAIEAQTIECPVCNGDGELNKAYPPYWVDCPTCKGRGRVPK